MIVVTVGTQLPFDRLIRMVDDVAPEVGQSFFAQIGRGTYEPKNIEWSADVAPAKFDELLKTCSVIVAHAGIGTVLKAFKYAKPIILVPRIASFGEHRNDHQLATIAELRKRPGIYAADSKEELASLLKQPLDPAVNDGASNRARQDLQSFVRQMIDQALA